MAIPFRGTGLGYSQAYLARPEPRPESELRYLSDLCRDIVQAGYFHRMYDNRLMEVHVHVDYRGEVHDVRLSSVEFSTMASETDCKWIVADELAKRLWPHIQNDRLREANSSSYMKDRVAIWGPKED